MPLNLVQHRSGPNVFETQGCVPSDPERWIASMVAGGLLFMGLRRRRADGWLMAAAGGALAYWAAATPEMRQLRRGQLRAVLPIQGTSDPVVEASEESFPASDATAFTPTTGNRGSS